MQISNAVKTNRVSFLAAGSTLLKELTQNAILWVIECVGHAFAYVAHFVFLRDDWIRTQRAAVANKRATNLATHLPTQPPISLA
jgi:hypothetical protein